MTGRQLYMWLEDPDFRAMRIRARRIGRARGYHPLMVRWSDDEATDVHREITQKPARDEILWGGPAKSGQAPD
jgi:hypothetical protein